MSVLETISAGTTGLLGVGLGAWLLERRERRRGKLDFVERQQVNRSSETSTPKGETSHFALAAWEKTGRWQ